MSLTERVSRDLTASMKSQDALRTGVLRMAKAALKNREIEKKAALDEAEEVKILRVLVNQREDSAGQFRKASRPELAEKEEAEIAVLRAYLPQEATEAEIAAAVERAVAETGANSPKDMGKVMKAALAILEASGNPPDGRKVSDAARKRLAGAPS